MSMGCRDVEDRVTAYLDGDLDAPTASALRGHLRGCEPCRHLAEDHARLAGALADLPPPDPSPAVWNGVLVRLADAEKADAERPRWRLVARDAIERIRRQMVPIAAVAAAAVVAVVWTVKHRESDPIAVERTARHVAPHVDVITPPPPVEIKTADTRDIEITLAAEARRVDQLYAGSVEELLSDVTEDRDEWPAARRRAFDSELTRLRAAVEAVPADHARAPAPDQDPFDAREAATAQRERRERAWQRLVAYLQRAAIGELEEARR